MILEKEELLNINAGTIYTFSLGVQVLAKKLVNLVLKLIRK